MSKLTRKKIRERKQQEMLNLVFERTEAQMSRAGHSKRNSIEAAMGAATKASGIDHKPIQELASMRVQEAKKPEGKSWTVTLIGPESPDDIIKHGGKTFIKSKNNRYYNAQGLKESVPMWDGIKVFDNHITPEAIKKNAGMRSVMNEWVGAIVKPWWDAKTYSIKATLKVIAPKLQAKLIRAYEEDIIDTIGLSIDAFVQGVDTLINGVMVPVVERITKPKSVDFVAERAAGGRLQRVLAGVGFSADETNVEVDMPELKELLEGVLEEKVVTRLDAIETRMEVLEANEDEEEDPAAEDDDEEEDLTAEGDDTAEEDDTADIDNTVAEAKVVLKQAQEALNEINKREGEITVARESRIELEKSRNFLSTSLKKSGLPVSFQTVVSESFIGRSEFTEEEVKTVISAQEAALLPLVRAGEVVLPDNGNLQVYPLTESDRHELAFLRLVAGPTKFNELITKKDADYHAFEAIGNYIGSEKPDLPRVMSLRDWYYQYSHDYDAMGKMRNPRFMEANVTTTNLTSIIKNTVNVLLADDYSVKHQWWDKIVRNWDVDTIDDATLVRVFGISTLDEVDEGNAYQESAWVDEEEVASYVKRGNYVAVTLETFLRDKLNIIRSIPVRLSNAFFNTVSELVSNVFTINSNVGPTLADGGALFNATAAATTGGHVNLLTAALGWTAYDAAYTSMVKQTDQVLGAGKRLTTNYPEYLLVPTDLRATGFEVFNTEHRPGAANFQKNPYGPDGQKAEVIMVPEWTDTDNWALVADPIQYPAIWLIWLRGRRTPEMFTADDERGGAMFTNDEVRFKIRTFLYRMSSTDNCAPVSDFRPLHKSNV